MKLYKALIIICISGFVFTSCSDSIPKYKGTDLAEFGIAGKVKSTRTFRYSYAYKNNGKYRVVDSNLLSSEEMYFNKDGRMDSFVQYVNTSDGDLIRVTSKFNYDKAGRKKYMRAYMPGQKLIDSAVYTYLADTLYVINSFSPFGSKSESVSQLNSAYRDKAGSYKRWNAEGELVVHESYEMSFIDGQPVSVKETNFLKDIVTHEKNEIVQVDIFNNYKERISRDAKTNQMLSFTRREIKYYEEDIKQTE